jgi:hypothetical protein
VIPTLGVAMVYVFLRVAAQTKVDGRKTIRLQYPKHFCHDDAPQRTVQRVMQWHSLNSNKHIPLFIDSIWMPTALCKPMERQCYIKNKSLNKQGES